MFPAFHIFGIHVSMYSIMAFLGVVAYFITACRVIKIEGIHRRTSNRLLFFSALGLVVLWASAYILNSLFHTIENGYLTIGGITWLGGVIGLFAFMIFIIHKFVPKAKGNTIDFFSLFVPGVVLGHVFGRIGCFFAGCCYGMETDGTILEWMGLPCQVVNGVNTGVNVLPTQLIEAAFELILFIVMMATRKKTKRYNVEIYLLAYGIFRFLLEFLRGDDRGSTGFFLTPSQLMCLFVIIFAVLLILYRNGHTFKKLKEKRVVWQKQAEEFDDTFIPSDKSKEQEILDAIKQLHTLLESGVITQEEYEEKKSELLKRL